jgi:hypothetical protein
VLATKVNGVMGDEETLSVLTDLLCAGKVRAIGSST